MDSIWLLYWITRFDDIKDMLGGFQFVTGLFSLLSLGAFIIMYCNEKEIGDSVKTPLKYTKGCFVFCLISVVMLSITKNLIPSKEDALMIAGGVVLTEIVQSEAAGRIASKSVLVVENWLDRNIPKEEKK